MKFPIFDRFKKQEEPKIKIGELAIANDIAFYTMSDFVKYNPDDLVGKKGFNIYAKMMADEQVKSVVHFKRSAITVRNYDFIFSDEIAEKLSDEEQALRIGLLNEIVRKMPGSFITTLNGILSSMWNGFSLTEKVYDFIEYDGRQWVGLKKLALRPADTFEFEVDDFGNIKNIKQNTGSKTIILDPLKFVHYVQNPDVDEHYGRSELRACYRAWFGKDIAIKNQNIFGSRLAGGFVWAELDENYSIMPGSTEEQALKDVMNNIQTKTSILVPRGVKLNIEMPASSNFFEQKIAQEDKAIAKSLLVPNLLGITEQGNVGSYSQSKTQLEAFLWTLDSEASILAEALNEQLFKDLLDLNFGDDLYPTFKFKPLSDSMIVEIAKTWSSLVKDGVVSNSDVDEDYIRDLLDFPPRDENEERKGNNPNPLLNPGQDPDKNPNIDPDNKDLPDETIIGEEQTRVESLSRAVKRVDFAAIDRKADVVIYQANDTLADAMDDAIGDLLDGLPEEIDPKLVSKIAFKSDKIKKINNVLKRTFKDAWAIGQQQASLEIKRAERQAKTEFSRKINMARLDELAAKYFDAQSFIVTGDLSAKATSIIKQELMNGIRYSKSTPEVRLSILERLASDGLISEANASAANVGLGLKNTQHVLDTTIRTSTFMSINESRHSFYTDPELGNFVVALEYSSILDSRTTEICNELGGANGGGPHVHSTNWSGWDRFRPPNHYNCRALLIPITQLDQWAESPEPSIQPQVGFG